MCWMLRSHEISQFFGLVDWWNFLIKDNLTFLKSLSWTHSTQSEGRRFYIIGRWATRRWTSSPPRNIDDKNSPTHWRRILSFWLPTNVTIRKLSCKIHGIDIYLLLSTLMIELRGKSANRIQTNVTIIRTRILATSWVLGSAFIHVAREESSGCQSGAKGLDFLHLPHKRRDGDLDLRFDPIQQGYVRYTHRHATNFSLGKLNQCSESSGLLPFIGGKNNFLFSTKHQRVGEHRLGLVHGRTIYQCVVVGKVQLNGINWSGRITRIKPSNPEHGFVYAWPGHKSFHSDLDSSGISKAEKNGDGDQQCTVHSGSEKVVCLGPGYSPLSSLGEKTTWKSSDGGFWLVGFAEEISHLAAKKFLWEGCRKFATNRVVHRTAIHVQSKRVITLFTNWDCWG